MKCWIDQYVGLKLFLSYYFYFLTLGPIKPEKINVAVSAHNITLPRKTIALTVKTNPMASEDYRYGYNWTLIQYNTTFASVRSGKMYGTKRWIMNIREEGAYYFKIVVTGNNGSRGEGTAAFSAFPGSLTR